MATVTGLTAERMQEIIDKTVVDADIIGMHLILTLDDGSTIDAGAVGPAGKGGAFPAGATDGDLFVRTDIDGDPLYKYTDGAWTLFTGGGVGKGTAFPTSPAPTDGDMFVRTDLVGDPLYKFTDGVWEQSPRMGALTVPSVSLARTTATPSASGETAIAWDSENSDTDSMHSLVTNTTRITINTPGIYIVTANGQLPSAVGAGQRVALLIRKNGTQLAQQAIDDDQYEASLAWHGKLVAGDYLELSQYSGAAVSFSPGPLNFAATWLGGAGQTVDERGVPSVMATGLTAGGPQNVLSSTPTPVSFASAPRDTDGMWSASAPTRLTAKVAGVYRIGGSVWWDTDVTGTSRQMYIRKNGTQTVEGGSKFDTPNANGPIYSVNCEITLAAGDYVELMVYSNSGTTRTIKQDSSSGLIYVPSFTATLVASGKTVTPYARVRKTTDQTGIVTGTWTAIGGFDTEDADNDGIHDTVTNTTRLTCRTAGIYLIRGGIEWSAGGGVQRVAALMKNLTGSFIIANTLGLESGPPASTGTTHQEVTAIAELAVGDYVELYGNQNSGGNLTAVAANMTTQLSMIKIGAPISGNTGVEVVEANHVIGGAGEPAFTNSWVNNTSGYPGASFYKDRGRVYFGGAVKTGNPGTSAFTLPAGYRPPAALRLLSGPTHSVDVNPDGTVVIYGGAAGDNRFLEGLSFRL